MSEEESGKRSNSRDFPSSELITLAASNTHRMRISDNKFEPDAGLAIAEDQVHLWCLELDAIAPGESRWRALLSPDEIARADRFHFSEDRQNFSATRAVLRILLGNYVDCDPRLLRFTYGTREKPALANADGAGVRFNVSHSGVKALIAFARGREVGVDIEQIRENFDDAALAKRFFSPAEQKALACLPSSEKREGFFRCWTRKEAYLKAHGAGLSLPLDSFDVSLVAGEQNVSLCTRADASEASRWSLSEVNAGEGYVAALCVEGSGWTLKS